MEEIWKDIKNYEGAYQISNFGNVKSLTRIDSNNHLKKAKIKNLRTDKDGYKIVILSSNGKRKDFKVHRLVALMFLPNPNNYPIINHKDENPSNNFVDNLEWCDYTYNVNYGSCRYKMSRQVNQYDKNNNFIKMWESITKASKELKIDGSGITKCCKGKRNFAGGYKWKYLINH